jgi:hypothetical protein
VKWYQKAFLALTALAWAAFLAAFLIWH